MFALKKIGYIVHKSNARNVHLLLLVLFPNVWILPQMFGNYGNASARNESNIKCCGNAVCSSSEFLLP
jgi:hypothetical protein